MPRSSQFRRLFNYGVILLLCLCCVQATRAASLQFASRTWDIRRSNSITGPGGNRFSNDSNHVWSDQAGLHLTIKKKGNFWFSTEVTLSETLGYGTYMFQTTSRQDILNANATFGAFTWDSFGDDPRIPAFPNREIDFEDSRWGNPSAPTSSQVVVQPYFVPGNLQNIALPDLSQDAALTRFFIWSPGRVQFFSLRGHHSPTNFPASAIIHQYDYVENLAINHIVPDPGRAKFHFNLWLNNNDVLPFPIGEQTVEVVINDFAYLPLAPVVLEGDFNSDGSVDAADLTQWQGDFGLNGNSDADGDGDSDGADLLAWQRNLGSVAPATAAVAVPEPSSLVCLLLTAVLSLQLRRSRALPIPT